MVLWIMSDRTIPRSLRMMEGFGIHTFRLVNAKAYPPSSSFTGGQRSARPRSTWDEAVKINGADPDFHRRDLYEAIASRRLSRMGVWRSGVRSENRGRVRLRRPRSHQDHSRGNRFPIEVVGRMVLDRNPVNFFAETEQVAFHPGHRRSGHRLHQRSAAAGPVVLLHRHADQPARRRRTSTSCPSTAPRCPMRNLQRDGMRRMDAVPGRVAYEPNSLDPGGPREDPRRGFTTFAEQPGVDETGDKLRIRPDSFGDHYSQAQAVLPFDDRSGTASHPERIQLRTFEGRNAGDPQAHARPSGVSVEESLAQRSRRRSAWRASGRKSRRSAIPWTLSPRRRCRLSARRSRRSRVERSARSSPMASTAINSGFARRAAKGGRRARHRRAKDRRRSSEIRNASGWPTWRCRSAPSVFFDAVAIFASTEGIKPLLKNTAAIDWVRDAFGHLKVIGHSAAAQPLFAKAGIADDLDDGVIELNARAGVRHYIDTAKQQRVWEREARLSGDEA